MLLTIELPDAIARQMHLDGPDNSLRALEMLALEAYRAVLLSGGQVGELLGMHFTEREQFLKDHRAYIEYTREEYEEELENLKRMTSENLPEKAPII